MNSRSALVIFIVAIANFLGTSEAHNQGNSDSQTFESSTTIQGPETTVWYESSENNSTRSSTKKTKTVQYEFQNGNQDGTFEDGTPVNFEDPDFNSLDDTILPDAPTKTIYCPGPSDPRTGQGVWFDGQCDIVCYNNLVLVGNDCTCPPTYHFDHKKVKCVCRSPRVEHHGKCILKPSQYPVAQNAALRKRSLQEQLPFAPQVMNGNHVRTPLDDKHCTSNEIACSLETGGLHCVDPLGDLEFCGGCTNINEGQNCSQLVGTKGRANAGCMNGKCVILSCAKGFRLINGNCEKVKAQRRL